MKKHLLLAAAIAATTFAANGQQAKTPETKVHDKRFYTSSSLDGAIFSMNTVSMNGVTNIPRFTYFINTGLNFNYDLGNHFGIYTGIGVKNLGYIEKGDDSLSRSVTVKRRVYAPGIPLGIKFGNLGNKGTFIVLGGGADFPVNYKYKVFVDGRKHKTKHSEWFSDEVSPVMPYVFAGVSFKSHFTVKFQYYPGNFMNQDFSQNGVKIYSGYDTHIAFVSLSFYIKNKNNGQAWKGMRAMMKAKKAK